MKFDLVDNEGGVSETVATILLVAVTVILAAIIASYIFASMGRVDDSKNVAATADRQPNNDISIVYHGGANAMDVDSILVYKDSEPVCEGILTKEVGSTCIFLDNTPNVMDHIIVVAKFLDANPQIILDVYL